MPLKRYKYFPTYMTPPKANPPPAGATPDTGKPNPKMSTRTNKEAGRMPKSIRVTGKTELTQHNGIEKKSPVVPQPTPATKPKPKSYKKRPTKK